MRSTWSVIFVAACGASSAMPDGNAAGDALNVPDGTPMRVPCTTQLGNAMTTSSVYDLAVNVGSGGSTQDVHTTTRDIPMPGPAWTEGWNTNVTDDYVALGVHASAIPLETSAQIVSDVDADLASANHISVFMTGYGPDGGHLIHCNGSGHDGLIVTQPLSSPAHARLFSFTSSSF